MNQATAHLIPDLPEYKLAPHKSKANQILSSAAKHHSVMRLLVSLLLVWVLSLVCKPEAQIFQVSHCFNKTWQMLRSTCCGVWLIQALWPKDHQWWNQRLRQRAIAIGQIEGLIYRLMLEHQNLQSSERCWTCRPLMSLSNECSWRRMSIV